MSKANPNMPYSTRSGISVIAGRDEDFQNQNIQGESIQNADQNEIVDANVELESDVDNVDVNADDEVTTEEDDVSLDRAILDQVKELTTRVDVTLAAEERCWYELESPHVRNKRPDFILKVELDKLDCTKNKEVKELLEVLKEVSIHYADAIDKVAELKKEVSGLKARLEPEKNDGTEVADDNDMGVDINKDGGVQVEVQSVDGSIDELSFLA